MNIQFEHKGNLINAKITRNYSQSEEAIFILPDRNLGELGWAIFLVNRNNQWVPNAYLEKKYPDTFTSLLSQLYQNNFSSFKIN
ncbi:MAG TPA: hypothetical protein VN958_14140 [Chitinophagaceae bacterium]|nr:hypothetical protein [Chitinophagaceae bacterium]